ncbi:SH3 domain-containing protein [Gottfriedia luciferensis]|uniref:hypothetical protein n=1 Tax=Gottfriedia luciferensis TaxID=178774 RepID=UPI000B448B0D|nr:hypothetical protein [Gottfriedia luciferensis]
MKKISLIYLAIIISIIVCISIPLSKSKAASTSAIVNANNLKIYQKVSTSSKKVGTLKKGTKIAGYSKLKSGWSEIKYKSKKANVMTKYLSFTKKNSTVSYLMNTQYDYVYYNSKFDLFFTEKFIGKYTGTNKKYLGSNKWDSDNIVIFQWENKSGLHSGSNNDILLNLVYPIKVGKTWEQGMYINKIVSDNETVKVKAGTFKKVIKVKSVYKNSNGDIKDIKYFYYAPNVGLVLLNGIDKNNKEIPFNTLYEMKKN